MNNPELDRLIKEKMQKYVPDRPIQIMHGGVIVLVSIVLGVIFLPTEQESAGTVHKWLGVYIAIGGLALYIAWTHLRTTKARKEANEEYLAASIKNQETKML